MMACPDSACRCQLHHPRGPRVAGAFVGTTVVETVLFAGILVTRADTAYTLSSLTPWRPTSQHAPAPIQTGLSGAAAAVDTRQTEE